MDRSNNSLGLRIILSNQLRTRVNAIKILKLNDIHNIWVWSGGKILIYDSLFLSSEQEMIACTSSPKGQEMLCRNEYTLKAKVIEVFYWDGEVAYVLDESGIVHSFLSTVHSLKSSLQYMDVDDMFCSPQYNTSVTWVQNSVPVMKVDDCSVKVISACQLTAGIAVLAIKNEQLTTLVYSYPDFNLQFFLGLAKYTPYIELNSLKVVEVISSCSIAMLTPSLKQLFQEHLHEFGSEIIFIGLTSGLVIWFCVGSPIKGPFILCSVHQQVQGIHWKKDDISGLFCNLLIVLASGRVVVFGEQKSITICLPESAKSSFLYKNYLVTSNLMDCYASIFHLKKETNLSCFLLAVKGVCAMASSPDLDTVVVATVHGSLYCLDPAVTPSDTLKHFVIPDQSLLDNMFIQTQTLEKIYLELSKEDAIMTAVSIAAAMNSIQNPFKIKINVVSDTEFVLSAKLLNTNMVFTHNLWLACVEVSTGKGERETIMFSLKEDFIRSRDLSLNVAHSLTIGAVVSLELVLSLDQKLPLIFVFLNEVEIDACHLMSSSIIPQNTSRFETSLLDVFLYSHKTLTKTSLKEFECVIKIPHYIEVDSILKTILKDSQHQTLSDSINTSGGNSTIQVCVFLTPVQFHLNIESKELSVTCCNVQLCHQIKESIFKRLTTSERKYTTENIIMDIQSLNESRASTEEIETNSESLLQTDSIFIEDHEDQQSADHEGPLQSDSRPSTSGSSAKKRRYGKFAKVQDAISKLQKISDSRSKPQPSLERDEYDKFADHIAQQMRSLPLRSFVVLQDKIQSLLTHERLNNLAVDSPLSTYMTTSPMMTPGSNEVDDEETCIDNTYKTYYNM